MSAKSGKQGQTDQRKVYLNWANHYLRKSGSTSSLSDLKEISDGLALPRVLKAVVQEDVPGIHVTVTTDDEKRENIEKCMDFLQKVGINSTSFTTKDLCDGRDRAILSLFYNLSQFKRALPSNQAPAPSKSAPSKIARPVSPGLKISHGVHAGSASSPTSPNPITAPVSPNPSPLSPKSVHKSQLAPSGLRMTAGSSIMTSTTFDRSYIQRRPSTKTPSNIEGEKENLNKPPEVSGVNEDAIKKGSEVKSDPESGNENSKPTAAGTKLGKHGSSSFHHTSTTSSDKEPPRSLKHPGASKTTAIAEGAESVTPPTQSKLPGPGGMSKLQAPGSHKSKGGESSHPHTSAVSSGDAPPVDTPADDSNHPENIQRPASRLKFPGSGRSTPSNAQRSGLQRPSSRLSKGSSTNLNSGGGGGGGGGAGEEEGEKRQLRLARKGSDGAVKRHQVNAKSALPGLVSPSGTNSLPRHLPKGSIVAGGGGGADNIEINVENKEEDRNGDVPSRGLKVRSSSEDPPRLMKVKGESEAPPRGLKMRSDSDAPSGGLKMRSESGGPSRGLKMRSDSVSKADGLTSNLRKPGGATFKKSNSFLSGVRTPNLPSGPLASTASEGSGAREPEGGASEETTPSASNNSPQLGKKLMQPPPRSLGSLLKRAPSPSTKQKLLRITPNTSAAQKNHTHESTNHTHESTEPLAKESEGAVPPALVGGVELSSSHSSLESDEMHMLSEHEEEEEKHLDSTHNHTAPTALKKESQSFKPSDLSLGQGRSYGGGVVSPPDEFKDVTSSKEALLTYGRRISPEGMSHEETTSPKSEANKDPPSSSSSLKHPLQIGNAGSSIGGHGNHGMEGSRQSRYNENESIPSPSHTSSSKVQRARSLSPKSSHRLMPKGVTRVKGLGHDGGCVAFNLMRAGSSESTSGSEGTPMSSRKPLKSSLRQKGGDSRRSSSSMESATSPRQPKVTISPRSSQLVYDPGETGLHPMPHPSMPHPPPSSIASSGHFSPQFLSPHASHMIGGSGVGERPSSLASVESSSTSDSISPSSSNSALFSRGGGGVTRHASIRSTMSEQLDYRSSDQQFLNAGMPNMEVLGSTPELIESFENRLTTMKVELSDKDRMLSMYENSMADLSSKMHVLKKSLEEKDNEIKNLTEKKTWFDLDGQSLMGSRAPSAADVHSDEYLSDSAMEQGKEKKKKKGWKNPFRSSKKKEDGGGVNGQVMDTMDTESIMSGRTAKSLKRSLGKKRAPDLMSISEYVPESRFRDIDTKSTYTMDARSEYGGGGGGLPLWEDDDIKVYEDTDPGAKAEVILHIDTNETPPPPPANDSGYYGDLLSRHGILTTNKWSHDSISSDSSNHSDDNAEFNLGMLSIPPETSWVSMDSKVGEIFAHHLNSIDPEGCLGLNDDSIYSYNLGEERRQVGNALLPPITPYQAIANKDPIHVYMKGAKQQSCDSLAYKTLMGVESLCSYMAILRETQWLVVMGTKGTCKSSLVNGLSHHLSSCLGAEEGGEGLEEVGVVGGEIITFNIEKEGLSTALKYFKADLVKRVKLQMQPPIVVLENLYECKDLEQLLVAAGALSRRPYIIAALASGTTQGIPLHQLLSHHQIRVITCNPQSDPVVGILTRSLRKQIYQLKATSQLMEGVAERLVNWIPYLLNHLNFFINKFHSNVVNLGPRVFMSCPLNQTTSELESWFISLWNHFIIPYLMGTIMAGIETYTADPMLEWVDVREWVIETYPWPSALNVSKLRTLNPEDVGWNHAVRPHHSRYIMVKDEKGMDDTHSLLQDTHSMLHASMH